ncbi:alpha/beta fold hydrolase [Acetobacteraceae bacterium H6797]|nr:alpha/beta fold hydrolase [Acetobacteraceae bacterium H6797]
MSVNFAEYGTPTGAPIVLLHGIGGNGRLWAPTVAALAHRRVLAWDMPGYGASAPLPEMTFPALAEALAGMLDRAGVTKADILGHSIGGMVAQEFNARFPERVASLILLATSAAFGSRDPSFAEDFVRTRLAPLDAGEGMAGVARGVAKVAFGEAPDPAAEPDCIAAMLEVPEASYRQTIACLTTFDRRDALASIAVPTLLVAGEHDRMSPPKGVARMAEKIAGSRFEVIAKAGHFAHLEQPAAFNAVLTGFLEA